MKKLTRKKIFIFISLIFILVNIFFFIKDKISGEHKFSVYNDPESVNYVNITNKEPIYQKFSVYNKKINAIVLRTSKEEKIEGYSQLNYKV